ncbi:MAG: mRNA interferase RelE/StbE [Bacteroidia bacterium]|jgi:mRNA interferase RelE/StbE
MEVKFKKIFLKDLKKLPSEQRARVELFVFGDCLNCERIDALTQVKKMSGFTSYYRRRFGDYRVGFSIEEGQIIFYRVLHRREIYRRFP